MLNFIRNKLKNYKLFLNKTTLEEAAIELKEFFSDNPSKHIVHISKDELRKDLLLSMKKQR